MRKFHVIMLLLGAATIVGAYRLLESPAAAKSPTERLKTASPLETIHLPRTTTLVPSSVPPAPASSKAEAKRAQMEERFTDLKEEGRRIRQALIETDPKAALAYQAISQRPEYRQVIEQRHQIEAAWENAPEGERDAMLAQMNSLRQQGLAMVLMEINRVNALPATPAPGGLPQLPATPGTTMPQPTVPVVFQ